MNKHTILLTALALLIPTYTQAGDVILSLTGEEITAEYKEPSTNKDGSPLTDLSHTAMFHNYGGPEVLARPTIPASALTGGGDITTKFVVPVPDGVEVDVDFWARAYDLTGNTSEKSNIATKRIDHLAPSAP